MTVLDFKCYFLIIYWNSKFLLFLLSKSMEREHIAEIMQLATRYTKKPSLFP